MKLFDCRDKLNALYDDHNQKKQLSVNKLQSSTLRFVRSLARSRQQIEV